MNRSFVSALLSLACLSTLPALAQAGSTQPDVTLSVVGNPTATGVSLTGTVQPPMPSTPTALPHPGGTLTFFDGGTALNPGGTALTPNVAYSSATLAQTFGQHGIHGPAMTADFNGDGRPDLLLYGVTQADTPSVSLWLQVFISNGDVTPSPNGPTAMSCCRRRPYRCPPLLLTPAVCRRSI